MDGLHIRRMFATSAGGAACFRRRQRLACGNLCAANPTGLAGAVLVGRHSTPEFKNTDSSMPGFRDTFLILAGIASVGYKARAQGQP
jgi:hypothetical protein